MNGEDILACAMRQGLDAESGHTCSLSLSLSLSQLAAAAFNNDL